MGSEDPHDAAHPPPPGGTAALLRDRQREYKMAALGAKRRGDVEAAAGLYRVAKSLDPLLAAAAQGQPVPPSRVPPPPEPSPPPQQPPAPPTEPPGSAAEQLAALQQRMEPYCNAAAQARSRGEERKARMHERIVKQYQDAMRALQAGRAVDLSELPAPPGFQPLHGSPSPPAVPTIAAVLETALTLANQEVDDDDDEEEGRKVRLRGGVGPPPGPPQQPPTPRPPPAKAAPSQPTPTPQPAAPSGKTAPKAPTKAQQQLAFLEGRRQQLVKAALRAKQKNDLQGAKLFLRQAKGVAAMMEASRGGLPVDISKVPEAPVHNEDFVLVQRRGAPTSAEANGRHAELMELLRQQHEMCVRHSKQFTQLGNIAETTKFEQLAEDCRHSMEVLKLSHAQGGPEPRCCYEQRTLSVIKTFPELSSSDLMLSIVRGINLPAPPGVAPNDLDAFVRFEFPHPSVEEAQRDRTAVVKNSDCPEFQQCFRLHINRAQRGLRRVLQGKGIKFEVTHKGGLFKPDRVVGAAQLKLEALETRCEVRELLEVLDGRRPTGGRLEVLVRIREPLSCQQLETRTERWLVLRPGAAPPVGKAPTAPVKDGNKRAELPCLSLLSFDCERLERKLQALRRAQLPVPPALQQQHQELSQRLQALRSQLQHCGTALRKEYTAQLQRSAQRYADTARRLGTEGHREAAKEALYKRNLVESELQKFRC